MEVHTYRTPQGDAVYIHTQGWRYGISCDCPDSLEHFVRVSSLEEALKIAREDHPGLA